MKKIMVILLIAVMMIGAALPISAAEATGFLHSYYTVHDDTLTCYGSVLPAYGRLAVSIGQQKNVDARFSTIGQENIPTTVFCLVDTSAGMNAEQMEQEISALMAISECMGPKDNMVIAKLSEEMYVGEPMNDRVARDQEIQSLVRSGTYTNLFQSVMQCLEILSTNSIYHRNRCLLILSDGIEDHKTSVTESQVIDVIRSTTIPVYSIGVVQKHPSQYSLEHARQIQRFANESVGGITCIPNNENINARTVGESIWKNVQDSSVISVTVPNVQWNTDSVQVVVRYEAEKAKYEGTTTIYALDLPDYEEPLSPSEETVIAAAHESAAPTMAMAATEQTEEQEKTQNHSLYAMLTAVAAGVVLIAAAVLLVLQRRSVQKEEQPAVQPSKKPTIPFDSFDATKPLVQTRPAMPAGKDGGTGGENGDKLCQVKLAAVSNRDIRLNFSLSINQTVTLGRDNRADIILNEKDPNLSGVHIELMWNGTELLVRDKNSTNGTSVNGISQKATKWMVLKNSDIIHAGNLEYRITFQQ